MTSAAENWMISALKVLRRRAEAGHPAVLVGQFAIDCFLNAGGFGITYLARDSLDRRVVVKECFPSAFCRRSGTMVAPRSRQRRMNSVRPSGPFVQEAMNLSQLDHPNIVKVHQVFRGQRHRLHGDGLYRRPRPSGNGRRHRPRPSPEQIRAILTRCWTRSAMCMQQGVLHRDISPDNILLDRITGRRC